MDARTPVAVAPPCSEPQRVFFYERFGRFFDWIAEGEAGVGRCDRCGAEGMRVVVTKAGDTKCVAQHSLTAKRHAPAKGEPLAYGAKLHDPERRGFFSVAADKSYCLVGPKETLFVGSVTPSSPLPGWLTAVHQFNGPRFTDLLRTCIAAGPESHPYLLADFTKKGDIPLALTTDPGRIVVNGTSQPVSLDKARLVEILELVREFGERRVKDAMDLKEKLSRGDKDARKAWTALRDKAPDLMRRFAEVPGKEEPERPYAFALADAEAREAKAAEGGAKKEA